MPTFQSFEEIEAWQEGRKLVRAIRSICKRENVKRDFAFVNQITRSVRSVPANIAEGFEMMTTPGFILFLGHAKGSAGEVRSHLYDALDEGYVTKEEFERLCDLTKKICSMLAKLIHYLQSTDQKEKRTMKNHVTKNEKRTNEQRVTSSFIPATRYG